MSSANRPPPGSLPIADSPKVGYEELLHEIKYDLANRPRDLQKMIGPSEIGEPCDRALIAKLMQLPEPDEGPNWRAWVGTCMHVGLADIFARNWMQQGPDGPRYLLEQPVTVGTVGGVPMTGSCDLFDVITGCVWDWKTKSKTRHSEARRHGLDPIYRVQFHSYGLGMENLGYQVTSVGGIFLMRDGELADTFYLAEPYDRQIAIDALARANHLHALASMLGAELAMEMHPRCTGEFCRICKNYRPPFGDPRSPQPSTIAEAVAAANRSKGN